ncbi:fungal-specific transcription factor domain-containing protein [Fusarium acuminatum]|uniref:Fungal-specific transcription factor domain-containing protein n=1 Tax=Fusarium acuminatum TaxID=5515 RepID=A0ABZ2X051_9HYPO
MSNLDFPAPPEKNMISSSETEPESGVTQTRQSPLTTRKRSVLSAKEASEPEGLRKARKVSRACDFCKSRKAKCSGDQPCAKCAAKGLNCLYDSKYTRGRPPTPPPSEGYTGLTIPKPITAQQSSGSEPYRDTGKLDAMPQRSLGVTESTAPSRASPELSIAEIQGQVFDPTSGLTFLHRALKRLSKEKRDVASDNKASSADPMTMTGGDKALTPHAESDAFSLPEPAEARLLLSLYFDVCIATYRILHKPTIESWLSSMEKNMEAQEPVWKGLGRAKAAIVLVALAIASLHRAKSEGFSTAEAEDRSLTASDLLFTISIKLADEETNLGYPKLETAQAKLIQVLYLLTTSRFNRAWYMFGNTLQLVAALGLHRRVPHREKTSMDYIRVQCGIRTFWTAYILDNYLGVIFGRPRHYHDDDIDQSYPDRIDDDDMTSTGPQEDFEEQQDCSIDALIFHAKCTGANTLLRNVHEWHASLPVHLGSVRPSMLIPSYRRQATVLKLAHSHAIMHANRLFLLGSSSSGYENQINECIDAAKTVLQSVDHIAQEGPIFHAFWWTHYVTFCALMVTYAWEAQQRRAHGKAWEEKPATRRLLRLAERCQMHLANATESNSPSRRYAVILEELRTTASLTCTSNLEQPSAVQMPHETTDNGSSISPSNAAGMNPGRELEGFDSIPSVDHHLFDEWNTMDWLALDSSEKAMYIKSTCTIGFAFICQLGVKATVAVNTFPSTAVMLQDATSTAPLLDTSYEHWGKWEYLCDFISSSKA